jgi:leucyl/phenylalanyl-tRNA--protein transferase
MDQTVNPEDFLLAYANGYFPMAESAEAREFHWYDPPLRGQLPIKGLHVSRRLRDTVLRGAYDVSVDTDFAAVIDSCAAATPKRPKTWINREIRDLFVALHEGGHVHSVECRKDGALVGGIYGLTLGGVFCGESMFSRVRDASKVALVHLCARLWRGGFTVFDTQLLNPHLMQFGAYEITREEYRDRLREAVFKEADFSCRGADDNELVRVYLENKTMDN